MHYLDENHILRFLVQLFVLLLCARGLGELFRRWKQPALTAELLVGILLGPTLLGRFLPGLHAALSAAETPLVATAPCDSPFLPDDLVFRLFSELTAADAELAVARTFDQPHPVFCLCQRRVLPHLSSFLASGERKFARWYATLNVVEVPFDDVAAAFENINTREELSGFESR